MFRYLLPLFTIVMLALSAPDRVAAQVIAGSGTETAAPELPDPLTTEAVKEMVARMSDDQVRAMLLDRLDAVAEAKAQQPSSVTLIQKISIWWTAFYTPTLDALRALPRLISGEVQAVSNFGKHYGSTGLLTLFGFTALALIAGFAAEKVVNHLTKRWQGKQTAQDASTIWTAVTFLFRRFCREILGLIAFYIVLRTVGRALLTPDQIAFAGPLVTFLIWLPRLAAAFGRFFLSPHRQDLRLVNVDDKAASYLYRHLIGLVLLMGVTKFVVGFNIASGVPLAETRIGYWFGGAVHIYIIFIAWRARDALSDLMRGTDPDSTEFDESVARAYPYYAIAVSALMWILVEIIAGLGNVAKLLHAPHYTSMFWLLILPPLDTLIRGIVRYMQPPMIGDGAMAEVAYRSTKRSYIRIGRVIVCAFVVLMIAEAWDIDLRSLAAKGVGHNFASNMIEFIMIVAVGYIIYELVSLWINRRLAKEQTAGEDMEQEVGGEGGGAGGSRLATVLPLILVTAQVAIVTIFSLLALSALGLDITPLLAGAGILGLAIGFGAQKLVTDVVSGVFFLIDDAFRVGEYVDVGGTTGTVEKISIRSMQLRHHRGPVHTIPYGEIPKLTNYSRDWVIMKLKFTVPFDTDPNKVKKIFKKIGAEMMADPIHGEGFLEPFKSQGVFDFDDVGMIIRGKFMAKPGAQFTIRKEIYNRVKNEFKAAGIDFARREVRVAIPGLEHEEHLTEEQQAAVGAAASGVVQAEIEQQEAAQGGKSGGGGPGS